MRYAGFMPNDFINGTGVSVSVWVQGCPFHCKGCHNPQTWDFKGGYEEDEDVIIQKIAEALDANGVQRNLSILGGEPLCESNIWFVDKLIHWFRENYPQRRIYLWTGYVYENMNPHQHKLCLECDAIIEGQYIESKRDVSLKLRGSSNQRIIKFAREGETLQSCP